MAAAWGMSLISGMFDVIGQITKIAAVENDTAIWEYDPTQEDNWVLGGRCDPNSGYQGECGMILRMKYSYLMQLLLRYKHLDSALSTSKTLKPIVEFHSYLSEVVRDNDNPSTSIDYCSTQTSTTVL
jgi:hypothetical protein